MYIYIYILYIYYIYIFIYIYYIYIFIYIDATLSKNAIVRLPNPRNGGSQGQETFLAPYTVKQTRSCDTECSNHHQHQSP